MARELILRQYNDRELQLLVVFVICFNFSGLFFFPPNAIAAPLYVLTE
jgi:hypothetical protein